jgi:hypothetical protein
MIIICFGGYPLYLHEISPLFTYNPMDDMEYTYYPFTYIIE